MKKIGCFVIFVIIAVFAFITNPSEKQHIEYAYEALKSQGIENTGINPDYLVIGEGLLGKENMNDFLKRFIKRNNYFLFSLTELEFSDEPRIVAIGAFGKIWTISDLGIDIDLDDIGSKFGK